MSLQTSGWFIGGGPLLMRCADLYLTAGHAVVGIASSDPSTIAWASERRINVLPPAALTELALGAPFDYLFSIGNHAILPDSLIAAPRRTALNFHYGPLPAYAGVHAPVWALLRGESRYGVTWHEMTSGIDAGRIAAETHFDVPAGETAAGLNARCFEAGAETFATLVGALGTGALSFVAQDVAPRTVFRRHQRPGHYGIVDWTTSDADIARLVCALDFGRLENEFGAARILVRDTALIVTQVGAAPTYDRGAAPGTILGVTPEMLVVASGTAPVMVRGLRRLTGEALTVSEAASELALKAGDVLPGLTTEHLSAATSMLDAATRHEAEWLTRLAGIESPTLPGRMGPPRLAGDEGRVRVAVDVPVDVLRRLGGSVVADPGTVLVALAAAYVARLTGVAATTLPLVTDRLAQRPEPIAHALLSAYVPMRVDLDQPWLEHLGACDAARYAADTRGSFFVDVCARYPGRPALAAFDRWRRELVICLTGASDRLHTAALAIVAAPDSGQLIWDASTTAYETSTVEQMTREFLACVEDLAAQPAKPLTALSRLAPADRHQLLVDWNRTDRDVPPACIHALFEAQVARTPDAQAVVYRDQALSYGELNRHANLLANRLRHEGIGPDRVVGLFVDRSIEMVVGLLGILKAGGAYLPLDPAFPQERLAGMLADTGATVLVTQPHLLTTLPRHGARVVTLDVSQTPPDDATAVDSGVTPAHLAYVIFTSGSTGRPKGVMVEHRQVANFFAGMDEHLGGRAPGVWLAVTSISFDISVLELFWTLARGYTVVVQEELTKVVGAGVEGTAGNDRSGMNFGLFYFSADARGGGDGGGRYRLLLEGAKYADTHGFTAVWTPERHFHEFGGLYPNPAVTSAAIAAVTSRVRVRAGSVVLPLHNPIRVAEEWAVVDQLSGGRVELSFASGWHANDFALMPQNYQQRRELMVSGIDTIRRLWRGESVSVTNGQGEPVAVKTFPAPLQERPPFWIAAAGSVDTFRLAGRLGARLLTNLLGQKPADLATKIAEYRAAWRESGHDGDGIVALMLHTFVGPSLDAVRETVRRPLIDYLKSSTELVKQTRWEFPAFANPSGASVGAADVELTPDDVEAMMSHAFERYFQTSGLFGTPDMCLARVRELKAIGVDEIACLVDFGIATDTVLDHLPYLNEVRARSEARPAPSNDYTIAAQIVRHGITHVQATPSLVRTILADEQGRTALARVSTLLVGGEPLPPALATDLLSLSRGEVLNMYGPTETTVWSSVARITDGSDVTIGRPITNTQIYIVDAAGEPQPVGTPGELLIGGLGVTRGYWQRPELTAERYVPNPCLPERRERLYRTGDLARYRADGRIECLGRLDHQVKISGHRIELGEIEAVLESHPLVAQSVVSVRADAAGDPRLVGYVVSRRTETREPGGSDSSRWQAVWNETYDRGDERAPVDPTFDLSGWRDSYTGRAMPAADMREWLETTAARLLSLAPRRILEVGCGTGLLVHRLAPQVEHYAAIDFSPNAIARVQQAVQARGLTNVTLRPLPADALSTQADLGPVDLVIINSVAQYFPDADYLQRVLEQSVACLRPGGAVWIGDVRDLSLLEAFHTSIELAHAPASMATRELRQRVRERIQHDPELVLAPEAFRGLASLIPAVTSVDVLLKRGRARNEMIRFRYDVILRTGPTDAGAVPADVKGGGVALPGLLALMTSAPGATTIRGLRDPRLAADVAAVELLTKADGPETVADLRRLTIAAAGIEPEDLIAGLPGWDLDLRHASNGVHGEYDATVRPAGVVARPGPAPVENVRWKDYVHQPHTDRGQLVQALKQHLRAHVPAYMVPATFVWLDALPLTPNGKIDRHALPEPDRQRTTVSSSFVAPVTDFERIIAGTWQDLLAVDRVGTDDNFFDLGANSLLMVQAHSILREKLARPLSLVDLFRFPTVSALAGYLGQTETTAPSTVLDASAARAQTRLDALGRRRPGRQAAATASPVAGTTT